MSLTRTGETNIQGIPVFVDEKLALPPQKEGRLSFKDVIPLLLFLAGCLFFCGDESGGRRAWDIVPRIGM